MLSKKELSEYYSAEVVEHKEFVKNLLIPNKRKNLKYPKEERFTKIQYPVARITPTDIWSQIPLYGTVVINLPPKSQDELLEYSHWGTDTDIQNLISLSKESGKVQFLLTSSPTDYESLDYLHPILEELHPPLIIGTSAIDLSKSEDKLYYNEFMNKAEGFFTSEMKRLYSHVSDAYVKKRIDDYAGDYIIMKKIGYNEIADIMLETLNTDPDISSAYFNVFGNLIAVPAGDPFLASYNAITAANYDEYKQSFDFIKKEHKKTAKSEIEKAMIPGEVGHFLMEKLVPLAKSYQSSIALMTMYKDRELHKLMEALNIGFKNNNGDIIETTSKELSEEFDNVWKDAAKITKLDTGISLGFSLSIIAIGALLTLPVGGIGAFAGLGFMVADKYLPSTSTKIADFFSPNHLVTINNFKKTHNIKS